MSRTLTAVCGNEIYPGEEYLELDGHIYCGCTDCMDDLFSKRKTVHQYDPEGNAADLAYDESRGA